jgi:hypothetical protein
LSGSFDNPLENNAVNARRSNIYYNIIAPYNVQNTGIGHKVMKKIQIGKFHQ